MKKKLLSLLIISGLFANSAGPQQGGYAHNAPNMNNCTQCHSGSVNSGNGSVTFTNLPESYTPGETYSIGVEVSGDNERGYGFQAIAQSGNNIAGEISLNSSSSNAEMNGSYVQHSSRTTSGSWVFDWVAPSDDVGEVTFSASGLATGGNNSGNGGDDVYTVSIEIPSQTPTDYITIAEARNLPLDASATVRGVVTTPNFQGNNTEYGLQDPTAGIVIFHFGLPYVSLSVGDSVEITGSLIEYQGKLEIVPESEADIIIISQGNPLPEFQTTTIENFLANAESFESELIRIDGASITGAGEWPFSNSFGNGLITDDGGTSLATLRLDPDLEIGTNPEPSLIFDVQGIAGQYASNENEYQILPRYYSDFFMVVGDPMISVLSPEDGSTFSSSDVMIEFLVSNFSVDEGGGMESDGHIHYTLDDGSPVMYYSTDPIALDNLSEGDHVFTIWLVDNNHSPLDPNVSDEVSFSVVSPQPSLSILYPEDGSSLNTTELVVQFTVDDFTVGAVGDDVDGHIHYTLNDGSPVMYYSTDPLILENLSEGSHTLTMWLVDNNHTSLDPYAGDAVTFSVSGPPPLTSIYDIQYVANPESDDTSPLNGQEVTIQGVVTAEFWGSNQRRFMHVQDAEGPWNGIVCYEGGGWDNFDWVDASGSPHPGPAEGDEVTLSGTINEYFNLTQLLDATSGIVHGESENIIQPSLITSSEIGEAYEGCLVLVDDVVVSNPNLEEDDGQFAGEWEFSDGFGSARCGVKWDYFYYPEQGQELVYIEGVIDFNWSNYKLNPRLARDVVEGGVTRIQRVQQVLYSDLMKVGEDALSDTSYMVGDTVTLRGVVTFPTGLGYAGAGVKFIFSDVNGGPWSSILSYDPDASAFPVLAEGDLVEVTGYIFEYTTGNPVPQSNMTEIFITQPINWIDFVDEMPERTLVSTGDLRWPTEAEQWGNSIVRIENGTVTETDLEYDVFEVDDGSGPILVDDDSDSIRAYFELIDSPPIGTVYESIEGWVYHHYGTYEDSNTYNLIPIYVEDLNLGSGPPVIYDVERQPCAPTTEDNSVQISCSISDNSLVTEALIHYSVDGGDYATVSMSLVDDETFVGELPFDGSTASSVFYYITALDDGLDQSEPMSNSYPVNTNQDQLGFYITDNLTIGDVQETPWPSGNSLYEDCFVTLTGVVTADTEQYDNSYRSYAFQDGAGQWSGMTFGSINPLEIIRGNQITISGRVTDRNIGSKFRGSTRLEDTIDLTVNSEIEEPAPVLSTCEDLHQIGEEVEAYEGVLVRLNNATISEINQYDVRITDGTGFEVLVDDDMMYTSLELQDQDPFLGQLQVGQELEYVIGIFNYSYGTYKVQTRDYDDIGGVVATNDDIQVNPYDFALYDNFPNPFNPETHIRFSIGQQEKVKLIIYDMMGRRVRTLLSNDSFSAGFHSVLWNGLNSKGQKVPSGIYIYRIKAGNFIADKKMLLVK